jgi:hypothetical protein
MAGGKKKWSKGRVREKIAAAVVFDKKTHDRLLKEVPKVSLSRRRPGEGSTSSPGRYTVSCLDRSFSCPN